jgi:predicted PurR-regulated permease PerM
MDGSLSVEADRSRIAWWGIVLLLGIVFAGFVLAFVGTFVLGLFFYYAVRPIHERVTPRMDSRGASTVVTLALVLVPVLAPVGYTVLLAAREIIAVTGSNTIDRVLSRLSSDPERVRTIVESPGTILSSLDDPSGLVEYALQGVGLAGTGANVVLHLTLALAVAAFLLRDGPRIEEWFRTTIADEDGVAEAYVTAVDNDLQTVYFGNVLSVVAVAILSLVVYHGFNLVTPPALTIPFPTLLALLTGLATFVPLVVGKLVYVPLTGYLAYTTTQADVSTGLARVGGFALVAFLVLDLVPQTFIRPYISGQSLHSGLVLLAYVLGAALFGWYGLFLGPLIVILVVQAANVVLPELLHGDPLTPDTYMAIGSNPDAEEPVRDVRSVDPDDDPDAGVTDEPG